MRARFPNVVVLLLVLSTAGCSATRWMWYRLAPDDPRPETSRLELEGLAAPVTVLFDAQGVPHVTAQSTVDLARAVGYLHGRDRFFEMDLMRRIAEGRLSALVGAQPFLSETTVEFDRTMTGWGFGRAGAEDAAGLDEETRAVMEAYVAGVNAARVRHRPIEHRLLGETPEPWRIRDSFAVARLHAWTVSHNWSQELSRLLLALAGGIDRAEAIYPGDPWPGPASLPGDAERAALPPEVAPELKALLSAPAGKLAALGAGRDRGLESDLAARTGASNGWVVGGAHTKSGKPLLANDPHLTYFVPAIFAQLHVRAPGLDAIGMSIPGAPWIVAGHNRRVAWGMTSAVADVIDLVVEKVDGDTVQGPDGPYPLVRDEVEIAVRGEAPRRFTLRRTRNGPVLNDLYPGLIPEDGPVVAIRMYAAPTGAGLGALLRVNEAKSVEDLRAALGDFGNPVNVFTAADVDGRVALIVNGRVPRRHGWRGTFPVPGWLPGYDWDGLVPVDEMPAVFGGEDTVLVHANNLVRDPAASAVPFHVDSAPSYRYERIEALLGETPHHDAKSFEAIETDLLVPRGARVGPRLLEDLAALEAPTEAERKARDLLARWDHRADPGSAAAAIFFTTYREAARLALEDEASPRVVHFLLSQRYMTNAIDLWFDDPAHPVWDDRRTKAHEARGEVVRAAFHQAVAGLVESQGDDPAAWQWGRVHVRHMTHLFGSQSALAGVVNYPEEPSGGGLDSVWKSHFDLGREEAPFKPTAGPVSRTVVDLADPDHGWWILNGGASGWPGSPHYSDQHALWAEGRLVPMVADWDELKASAAGELTLAPGR